MKIDVEIAPNLLQKFHEIQDAILTDGKRAVITAQREGRHIGERIVGYDLTKVRWPKPKIVLELEFGETLDLDDALEYRIETAMYWLSVAKKTLKAIATFFLSIPLAIVAALIVLLYVLVPKFSDNLKRIMKKYEQNKKDEQ